MTQEKAIYIQTVNINSKALSGIKEAQWISATVDNVKITINAYSDGSPRLDALMEVADRNNVYNLTPEQLIRAIRFFAEYAQEKATITVGRNKFHYIKPDALKTS